MKKIVINSLLLILITIAGCSKGVNTDDMFAKASETNVQKAAVLYCNFQARHSWTGPKDQAELIEFAKTMPADRLKLIGVDVASIDEFFIGSDGQPLKIRFEVKATPRDAPKAIVFESSPGENGKYRVGFTGSVMKEVDKSEYDRLWGGRGDSDAPDDPQQRRG